MFMIVFSSGLECKQEWIHFLELDIQEMFFFQDCIMEVNGSRFNFLTRSASVPNKRVFALGYLGIMRKRW